MIKLDKQQTDAIVLTEAPISNKNIHNMTDDEIIALENQNKIKIDKKKSIPLVESK